MVRNHSKSRIREQNKPTLCRATLAGAVVCRSADACDLRGVGRSKPLLEQLPYEPASH